ncbi:autotransporter outer membrane beta-barrel domain-containing protein [Ralstonia sp. ASV6]|uniref:autotransporter outer membrane beta-barrel domain-containing protein n=1 Tax=Ralstonia sp. ASV6 TaxID=2795124 RepID=UPI0018EDCADE|nr:autotransporter outer membrane beta-barrel domain-containing protein [Ralstonia sp. ASV6]
MPTSSKLVSRRRERQRMLSMALVASPLTLFAIAAKAACVTSGAVTTCDTTNPNPWTQTVGTGNKAVEDNRTVTVQTGSTISVGSANAISLRDNANINVQGGATVSNNATSGPGLFNTGNNTIEFRNNGTLTVAEGGSVLSNGRQNNGEAVNVMGSGNTVINNGTIRSNNAAAIWFDNLSGSNTIVNNETGVIQAPGNVIGSAGNASVDFTNKGIVRGNLVFAGGDDTLRLYTGSTITGNFDGGGGSNTIYLSGTGDSALPGNISNFQTLIKNDTGTWTLTGTVSGVQSASVQQGTLILTGNNAAYTGNITVDAAGTLQGRAQSLMPTIVNNGLVRFDQPDAGTYAGLISGTGAVEKTGAGTLTLAPTAAGGNTYTGGTSINGGTVAIGADNALGAATGGLSFNGGTLQLNQNLDLAGTRAVTLNAGGGTIDTQGFASMLSQGITGSGALTKLGSGVLTLNGSNSVGGGTTVAAGTLVVGDATHGNASLAGSTLVNSGATLGGFGTVTGSVRNDGTLAVADAVPSLAGTGAGTGTFTINGALFNTGLMQVGGAGMGNRLAVNGGFMGAGGTLALNTQLGADNSPTDQLVLSGGGAAGNTAVRITNVGGAGAQTTGNGIPVVVAINGATTQAGAFALGAPVVAGPYEYTLHRGGNGSADSWYLRSTRPAPDPDPTPNVTPDPNPPTPNVTPDPNGGGTGTTPTPEVPNYRPEVSLYTAVPSMVLMYSRAMLDTLHERVGDETLLRTGVPNGDKAFNGAWARVIGQKGSRMSDGGIYGVDGPAFDYKLAAVQLGGDVYRAQNADNSRDHAGVMFSTGRITGDVTHADGTDAGSNAINATTVGVYWTHFSPNDWYVDAVAQGTRYDVTSSPTRMAGLTSHGLGYALSLETGYPIALENRWRVEPQAQLIYQRIGLADGADPAAQVHFGNAQSLLGRVGVRVAKDWGESPERPRSTWFRASVWQEFRGTTTTSFSSANGWVPFTSSMPATVVDLQAGVTAQFTRTASFYASVGYQISTDGRLHGYDGKLGLRWNW